MSFTGTVVNGVIVLEGNAKLPEGTRVWVELDAEDDIAPPPEAYDREKELALLREGLEDIRAGRTVPAREAMEELARKYGFPGGAGE